ncbi:MAG: D-glycerate dehydrogenase [Thermoproteota archaeon]|nr:D-glycerate dehydrogenase [Thermoproteota archaeon]
MKDLPTILITRNIPLNGIESLKSKYKIIINKKNRSFNRTELINNVKNVDAILCVLQDNIDKVIIDTAGPKLKIISTFSTGFEHIDVETAKKRGIKIGYTGDILTETTADLTFGLILGLGRRIIEADKFVRKLKWKNGWSPQLMLGTDIHHKILGIIGFGKIGQCLAKRAIGFNMKIIYYKRNREITDLDKYLKNKVEYCELKELLAIADYIVICCSFNKESFHLIDIEKIKIMKETAFIINTSRGKIVNENDLVFSLKNKYIAGAALDVFEKEPISQNSPLIKMNNVILLPHIGSASIDTRKRMAEIAVTNIINVLEGNDKKALLV